MQIRANVCFAFGVEKGCFCSTFHKPKCMLVLVLITGWSKLKQQGVKYQMSYLLSSMCHVDLSAQCIFSKKTLPCNIYIRLDPIIVSTIFTLHNSSTSSHLGLKHSISDLDRQLWLFSLSTFIWHHSSQRRPPGTGQRDLSQTSAFGSTGWTMRGDHFTSMGTIQMGRETNTKSLLVQKGAEGVGSGFSMLVT